MNAKYAKKITSIRRGRVGVCVAVDMQSKRATILSRTACGKGVLRTSAPMDAFDILLRPEERKSLSDSLYTALELEGTGK